jgi:hypothetical protein
VGSVQMGRNVLRPQIEFRDFTTGLCLGAVSKTLCAGGTLFSIGARYQMPIGDRYSLLPLLRLDAGNVVNPITGRAVSFTGWDIGVTLRATL